MAFNKITNQAKNQGKIGKYLGKNLSYKKIKLKIVSHCESLALVSIFLFQTSCFIDHHNNDRNVFKNITAKSDMI